MIWVDRTGVRDLSLFGAVRGLSSEAEGLRSLLEELRPAAIGIGLTAEEVESLREHFVGRPVEPAVPLLSNESVEIRELSRFGESRVPNPSYLAALDWGGVHGAPVEAVEPSEERYAELFGERIGYWELVRRTLRERRLLRAPPKSRDADSFVLRWDQELNRGRKSQRLQREREAILADGLRRLAAAHRPTLGVVDRERVPGVLAALGGPPAGGGDDGPAPSGA